MSGAEQLFWCADNLFNVRQYPDHVVSGSTEATGYEAFHVGTNRREAADAWKPTSANISGYVTVTCLVTRGMNFVAIDRESNHAGKTFALRGSSDGFTTYQTIVSLTVASVPGGSLSGAYGAITSEGAWLKTVTAVGGFDAYRLWSEAMGSGVTQRLTGVWVGTAWQPSGRVVTYPMDDETYDVRYEVTESPSAWAGMGRVAAPRIGTIRLMPNNENDAAMIRWQVLGLYARLGQPAWVCWQKSNAPWRSMLVRCPPGAMRYALDASWPLDRMLEIPYIEVQPKANV